MTQLLIEQLSQETTSPLTEEKWYTPLTRPTPLSKYLALVLFIILPFVGFWLGVEYAEMQSVRHVIQVADHVPVTNPSIDEQPSFVEKDDNPENKSHGCSPLSDETRVYTDSVGTIDNSVVFHNPRRANISALPIKVSEDDVILATVVDGRGVNLGERYIRFSEWRCVGFEPKMDAMLYSSRFRVQGMVEELVLKYDGTWTYTNNLPGNTINTRGTSSQEVIDNIVALLEREGVHSMNIAQTSDLGAVCEGGRSWEISINGMRKNFRSPCVHEQDEETKQVGTILERLDVSIKDILGIPI